MRKKQQYYEAELKNTNHFTPNSTTIFGLDWRKDFLLATAGNTDNHTYTTSVYAQHDMVMFPTVESHPTKLLHFEWFPHLFTHIVGIAPTRCPLYYQTQQACDGTVIFVLGSRLISKSHGSLLLSDCRQQ
jgi:hypothetical protein